MGFFTPEMFCQRVQYIYICIRQVSEGTLQLLVYLITVLRTLYLHLEERNFQYQGSTVNLRVLKEIQLFKLLPN